MSTEAEAIVVADFSFAANIENDDDRIDNESELARSRAWRCVCANSLVIEKRTFWLDVA